MWDEPFHNFGLAIDGPFLAQALKNNLQLLAEVSSKCQAVVCCRLSPIQKAQVHYK